MRVPTAWGTLMLVTACASNEPKPEPQAAAADPAEPSEADQAVAAKTGEVGAENVGKRVLLKGWAVNRKGGAVLVTDDGEHVWIDGLASWPDGYYRGGDKGKRLRVSGTLDEDHGLPVFVQKEGEPIVQGVPVPEGTDLEKASHRFVLRDASW